MEINYVNAEHTSGKVTVSDRVLEQFMEWDEDTIFGMPGDGVNGFVEVLRKKHQNNNNKSV